MGVCVKNGDFLSSFSRTQVKTTFIDDFVQNNHLDLVTQKMEYHPNYLQKFISIQNCLLNEDGPLPFEYRHYIAIIASSRHHCTYLMKSHEQEFLLHCGNPEWLKGIEHAPHKLQDLNEINKILAHQPWLITKHHMAKLLRSSEPWSLSELMHAIILLVHFHSLCSFVYGCSFSTGGADSDVDCSSDTKNDSLGVSHSNQQVSSKRARVGLDMLKNRIRNLTTSSVEDMSSEQLIELFICLAYHNEESLIPNVKRSSGKIEIPHFEKSDDFAYTDFATRDSVNEVTTFRASDYSWEDHGFSLVSRLYPDIGNLLDDKYNIAANMTSYTMGDNKEIDTSFFGQAIWNYIHSIFGIRHDDYNYSKINQLLERSLKACIKTGTCYPERLQKKDYDGIMWEFTNSEKVHLNLILMEARQQAELLYALRALNEYIT